MEVIVSLLPQYFMLVILKKRLAQSKTFVIDDEKFWLSQTGMRSNDIFLWKITHIFLINTLKTKDSSWRPSRSDSLL